MKAFSVFTLICIAVVLSSAYRPGGPCESTETLKSCTMKLSTVINSKDFLIASDRDETVVSFLATRNKNIEYLPINLGVKFPNLSLLDSAFCSIKEISKDNFKGLSKLQRLRLHNNQIEKIDDDTFEYNPAIVYIYLFRNKIKKLNGRAFTSLHKLTNVNLLRNGCIHEDFYSAARIAEMSRSVTEKCGFTESDSEPFSVKIGKLEADMMAQSEELQALKLENEKLRLEKAEVDLQIAHCNEVQARHTRLIELKLQEIVLSPL